MFPYDSALLAAATTPESIADVVEMLKTIQCVCADGDGLKWFNGLYLEVTQAVQARVAAAGFGDPQWIATLDVRFARFYFAAVQSALTAASLPSRARRVAGRLCLTCEIKQPSHASSLLWRE